MSVSGRRYWILAAAALALNASLWLAQGGFALPGAVIDRFFGPHLVRAEVVLQGGAGAVRDYRLDRGVITSASPGAVVLREKDGTEVTIQVAPGARVVGLGRGADVSRLRPRMRVLVIRQATAPADLIEVETRAP